MAIYDGAGNKIRRNALCPCGSKRKFKHCHGKETAQGLLGSADDVAGFLEKNFYKARANRVAFEEKHGRVNPIISGHFRDWRFVAVGDELHYSKIAETKYFPDFLMNYIGSKLGSEWGMSELEKPIKDRHPALKWHDSLSRFQKNEKPDEDGVYRSSGNGSLVSWYRLAYDLYLLKHNADLQERLLNRIRNRAQFQGARFELFVAASMIVAGFEIAFEDEADSTCKHTEFLATHCSGMRIAVEAKSRHRDGVLEYRAPPRRSGKDQCSRVGVEGLIRKALAKDPDTPYFIFIDLNLPYLDANLDAQPWLQEINETVRKVLRDWLPGKFPANAIFFCNDPTYQSPEIPPEENSFLCYTVEIDTPRHPLADQQIIRHVAQSIMRRNNIPNEFPEQETLT